MANTKMEFMFQISYATLITRLLTWVFSDIKVNYSYISDLGELFHANQMKDGEHKDGIYF